MKNFRVAYGLLSLGFVLIIGGAIVWHDHHKTGRSAVTTEQASKPTSSEIKRDPLEIEAMKARRYQASDIQTVRGGDTIPHSTVVTYQSDNNTVFALMALPDQAEPQGGYPVIILCHGYEDPSLYKTDTGEYQDWINAWTAAGFAVLKPDYRGNGESTGTPSSGHYSPEYTYDIMNLIASAKHDNRFDPKRIGVVGHSMGGHVALRAAVISPDIKATALVSGVVGSMYDLFYNWPHSPAPNDKPSAVVKTQISDLIKQHGEPKTDGDFYNKVSAINFVKNVSGPIQIDASTGDSTVPFAFSQHLNDALTKAHKSTTLYQYSGDDHQMSSSANHQIFIKRTVDFFKANL